MGATQWLLSALVSDAAPANLRGSAFGLFNVVSGLAALAANDQALSVAMVLTGTPRPYGAVPWFWSNQYDLRLQSAGLSGGHDTVVTRGDPSPRRFSLIYLREGRLIAIDSVNAAKDFTQARALVTAQASMQVERLRDPSQSLKFS